MTAKQVKKIVAVAGNPNCGKTTLFNSLTGGKQKIGNWPGVTVEKKEGLIKYEDENINLIDLPGIYALSAYSEDEKVARDYLLSGEPDLVINIIDATNLERNLYLTCQLIEMKVPILIVLNMMDIAKKKNIDIDVDLLSKRLGITVLDISAINKCDIEEVKDMVKKALSKKEITKSIVEYPNEIEDVIGKWTPKLGEVANNIGADERWVAIKILEDDAWVKQKIFDAKIMSECEIKNEVKKIEKVLGDSTDIILADYRYGFIHGITKGIIKRHTNKKSLTDKIDKVILHRILGIPIFLVIMYLVFWVTINIGGAFIDFFDILFGTIFVDGFGEFLGSINTPTWLITIFAGGVGAGIQTVATFIPVIFMMFLMLSILEDSGYMARAAFVMDKFMRLIGLPGKSFVPMLVGFGCTVPAVMATRTLENKKDRYLTIFMSPFMSCGARLPVYVLFTAAFFPKTSGSIVFSIYLVGVVLAILTGVILKNTLFKGEASYFIMELPPYHLPRFKHIMLHTWNRLKLFIFRAGTVIVIIVTILSFLNSLGVDGSFGNEDSENSVLAKIGNGITPIFEPMGIEEKNWPASVAIFTGLFAKEAVVGTLNALYSQLDTASEEGDEEEEGFNFFDGIKEAFISVPQGLIGVFESFVDPFGLNMVTETDKQAILEEIEVEEHAFTSMQSYFSKGWVPAYAYLLFILIYFPCIAALGAVIREIGIAMGSILVIYLTILGWIVATLFYQITMGHQIIWIGIPVLLLGILILGFYILGKTKFFQPVNGE